MPWVKDKILIDGSMIDARLGNLSMLAEEMEEMGLLASPEGVEFDRRLKALCYPFAEGLESLEKDMLEYVNKHFQDRPSKKTNEKLLPHTPDR